MTGAHVRVLTHNRPVCSQFAQGRRGFVNRVRMFDSCRGITANQARTRQTSLQIRQIDDPPVYDVRNGCYRFASLFARAGSRRAFCRLNACRSVGERENPGFWSRPRVGVARARDRGCGRRHDAPAPSCSGESEAVLSRVRA
jgi:hypothetical protein